VHSAAREAQYRVIYSHRGRYEVKAMCEFFGVSRAAYYKWAARMKEPDRDEKRMKRVEEVYLQSRQTYGYRRVTLSLRQRGERINHKTVLRLMNKLGICSIARRRKVYRKLETIEHYHCYPNRLNRDFHAEAPNQKWVTDITYIRTLQGWAYLSVIKDLYDGFIVAHHLDHNNSLALVLNTLRQAAKEMVTDGLILHSDRGNQYTSQAYFSLTHQYNMLPSMSRPANCWDNAPAENFFSHLKEELVRHMVNPSFDHICQAVDDYIYFYNYHRIQLKTGQTPYQIRCLSG
jgi:putative transposase